MNDAKTTTQTSRTYQGIAARVLPVALLLIFFLQVTTASRETSLTSDEGPQLTSGYSYLVTGDPHLIEFDGHPPFAKVLNALPMLPVPDLASPDTTASWTSTDPISLVWVTQEFLYPYRPLDRLVSAARLPVALWGILLGALIYRWATDLFGPWGGAGALALAVFDPNLLAHAGLATNDLPVTATCFAAIFSFWRCLRRPTPWHILLAGITLGLAQATKLNATLLLPVAGLLILLHLAQSILNPQQPAVLRFAQNCQRAYKGAHARSARSNRQPTTSSFDQREKLPTRALRAPRLLAHFALILLIAVLTLWATYGFELRTLPGWPFPVPAGTHLSLFTRVAHATGGGHPAFLMGEISTQGWWHYFPVAFAIKTPLPTLIALVAAVVSFFVKQRRSLSDEVTLALFPLLYFAATVVSRLNIGYRHLLPILPFLYVWAGRFFGTLHRPATLKRAAAAALGIWLVAGTLAVWPFHLTFFNELIGGADQGYHYLVDSNTDWGQAHKALRHYMDREGIAHVKLSTYIEFDAAMDWYGIDYEPLPPLHAAPGVLPARFNPAPGVYAISSTTLQGIFTADPEMYDWFRKRPPDAIVGHAMLIFNLPKERAEGQWIAQCSAPVAPLTEDVISEGFGRANLAQRYFDCTQSWIIPEGGQTPGWYALFRDTALSGDRFIEANLATSRLSFEQVRSTTVPPFAIYASEGTSPAPAIPVTSTIKVGDLTFLGHTVAQPEADQPLEVWTFWRVVAQPARPLSLMLHLSIPGTGQVVAGDGLGVLQTMWHVDDVIVQRHRLPLPADAPSGEYTLYTGAYWLDTQPLERWAVTIDGQKTGEQVPLSPVWITRVRSDFGAKER